MSFITKRERVFNEYDLFELPARNEGKLKAYASCTDARAWSHFCSDKSEHLVEIIKRNNETVRPKYLPTNVIVDTLMVAKNAEIARLKRRIEEFEQMLAVYDQLELTCDQKCEIANAHAAIKAANKELDDLCLDLDLSCFTEAIDSEAFETGKSRGDGDEQEEEISPKTESKSVQMGASCTCDVGTYVKDPRIDEMQDAIISKDAKLNAMKNTIAVMENDVCEPYCIYAHIYTALEKIFGILCQNEKYKQYLNLLTAGKDTRCIDIKGKILYKLKVLEKFCVALIAPCNREFSQIISTPTFDCACYRSEITKCVETNFAMTSAEAARPNIDNKRAHLVADIIQNEEMKEILSKESFSVRYQSDLYDDTYVSQDYNLESENLERLKKLQENYDDLMTCYEALKHEKECLEVRCHKYEDLEKEFEALKLQVKEYNSLWNEKEHYRKRSADLDSLKEQYYMLSDETASLETKLKAEAEINHIKCKTIDDLRNENVLMEKKLNESLISFEKEKNCLLCKLKEADCRVMCQGQQIKSLSIQIDRLLEQDQQTLVSRETENTSLALIDEVESYKDQIKNLKELLFCNDEEKQHLQQQYQDQLKLINELRMEVDDWKSAYEKTLQRNDYLEKYAESLIEENRAVSHDADSKSQAIENLMKAMITNSQQIDNLISETERRKSENKELHEQIDKLRSSFDNSVASLENEKLQALKSLQLARKESQELLEKVKDYDEIIHAKADVSKSLEIELEDKNALQDLLINAEQENKNLKMTLAHRENNNSILLQENQKLQEDNKLAAISITNLQNENEIYKKSIEMTQRESGELKMKLLQFDNLVLQLQQLQESHEKLIDDKNKLERELLEKNHELDKAIHCVQLTKRESDALLDKLHESESAKDELLNLSEAYQKLANEKHSAQKELLERKNDMDNLLHSLNNMKLQNEHLLQKCREMDDLERKLHDCKSLYNDLLSEKKSLQDEFNNKKEEYNNLYNLLERKIEENRELKNQIISLEANQTTANNSIKALQDDKLTTQASLNVIKKESAELIDKIKHYESLETEYDQLKRAHNQMKLEKDKLQSELDAQLADLRRIEKENSDLSRHSQHLISHTQDLENALVSSRTELIKQSTSQGNSYKNILMEIEEMRREKLKNQKKIRDLLDKLDESENIISNLSEDVLARDDRIVILENYINELEDEVRKLHLNLDEVVDTGEQMRDFNFQKIDTIKNIEAHHSKATHNMKMELAKLQNQNAILEEQLSVTKIKSNESSRDNNRYISQLVTLQNEREIIVTDIKQLELKSVGDSALAPNNCDVEDVLLSLDRIRKAMDARNFKSTSLEQTILKVQTSSQLLLSKADEAKRLVEKEKQKIINEKEDAVKDKQNMEKQLLDLKEKLEKQIANDKIVIKDLEATILNQKLIIDQINQSTQDYISKLKEELKTLQGLYQNSLTKIRELQEKLQAATEDKNNQMNMLEKIKRDLNAKSEEVNALQTEFETLKNKPILNTETQTTIISSKLNNNMETQTKIQTICLDRETQTDEDLIFNKQAQIRHDDPNVIIKEKKDKKEKEFEDIKTQDFSKLQQYKPHSISQAKQKERLNEIQIMTANVEPSFDYVRNSYMNYKIKCLSTGKMEHFSITSFSDDETNDDNLASNTPETAQDSEELYSNNRTPDPNLIDIYNRRSIQTSSSKANYGSANTINDKQSTRKSSAVVAFATVDSNMNSKNKDIKPVAKSSSQKIPEKDLFVIYKDSQSSYNNKDQERGTWSETGELTGPSKKQRNIDNKKHTQPDAYYPEEEDEKDEDDSVKHKLKIKMPRVENESTSLVTTSEGDKKSSDSFVDAVYSLPKHFSGSDSKINIHDSARDIKGSTPSLPTMSKEETVFLDDDFKQKDVQRKILRTQQPSLDVTPARKHEKPQKHTKPPTDVPQESHHKLARVGANVLLLKTDKTLKISKEPVKQKSRDFGLEYILDTVNGEVDPEKNKKYSKDVRSSRSEEMFTDKEQLDSNHSRLYDGKMSSTEFKATPRKSGDKHKKSFTERSITVKLDSNSDYENTINSLTKALENIEKDYKKKIEAIKMQYDSNIKNIINEHNQGVKSIQGLHEETMQDIIKMHENEVENLRSMSIEAMRKAEKLEKENRVLKTKVYDRGTTCFDEEPIKIGPPEVKKRRRCRGERILTKTTVEAFNVKPKMRSHGPCTCSLDVNVSDTIRNIFEQVDVEQRKMAEHTYIKYIANKMLNGTIEILDAQELSFLHLKVCRIWKSKLCKEEALQKRIDSLETELLNKQRNTQQHIAELDRKVAEERRRLQEVRDAVCRSTPRCSPARAVVGTNSVASQPPTDSAEKDFLSACGCNTDDFNLEVEARGSAGDLLLCGQRPRLTPVRKDINRAVAARLDMDERRERKLYNDEPPTRLRRSHDRQMRNKK
ncbi:uncharacterized protein LOC142987239 isoform X2 [Anticarsia gemmatalis]|uniref:uncharacterized protein LOC142987239 isoform X2 n=1 Tax=Anticarsia gemmatalis TaxID=129554 RepID=UPI003F75D9DE